MGIGAAVGGGVAPATEIAKITRPYTAPPVRLYAGSVPEKLSVLPLGATGPAIVFHAAAVCVES